LKLIDIFGNKQLNMEKKLTRSDDRVLAGVCAGFADYFGFDKTLVRVIYLLLVLFGGVGILVYIIFWILMPTR
jgi:phage shock protein PspC (stress-responsive transcriptional regulator)